MTKITRMQMISQILNHPKNMHIEFLCISEVAAGRMTRFYLKLRQAICTLVWNNMSTRDRLHNSSFVSNQCTHTITLTLHCSSTMVGGHEKQSDFNTKTISSSASASAVSAPDWDIAPPLQNVRVDTQDVGVFEEQKQQIEQLQEELAEFNCI
jgi:hypothetical protein